MFYVFLVGLAKLHCGATPPSVMVLFYGRKLDPLRGLFLDPFFRVLFVINILESGPDG